MRQAYKYLIFGTIPMAMLAACSSGSPEPAMTASKETVTVNAANWPKQAPTVPRDPEIEQAIAELLARMTLEEKVGQVIQADIGSVTPADVREYNLGSILNGGSSAPGGDNRTTPDKWLELADEFWDASTDTSDGGVGIPTVWGTDAVHGNSNVLGATLFPHNIGLGMANDPDLMFDIGRVTALEILATGLDWTFAPTIAVARNDRWGRTYESYSEDPRIVAAYAPRIIEGIQGKVGSAEFLSEDHMFATAKHFAGDGGTTDGVDQGETATSEAEFRDIQAAGYPAAVAAGVQSVMASFNSFHGRKMHGYKEMLTDVLVGRMGFDGFVVGDWNGHGQVASCDNTACAASMNAGLDMFMAPDSWKGLYKNTLQQVKSGEISMARLDEAVSRILRVKFRAGVFDAGRPSSRKHAGDFSLLAADAHRATARDAVRKSLVLLKNNGALLPLAANSNVLVAGDGAHNIGKQSGGWTLNWQGTENLNEHFPNGTSIFAGIAEAVEAGGGSATLSVDGSYSETPDVAIVVFGENPYAEGVGDVPNVDYASDDGLELLTRFRAAGIPTVSVFITGRPLFTNPEINASDAFLVAWLPGSEGAGVADVMIGDKQGTPRFDLRGRLSFSWPKNALQANLNVGDADYDPQFPYGYGLSYTDDGTVAALSETSVLDGDAGDTRALIENGDPAGDWIMVLRDDSGDSPVQDSRGTSSAGSLIAVAADRNIQEDSLLLTWTGPASLVLSGPATDFSTMSADSMALEFGYQVIAAGGDSASIAVGSGSVDVTAALGGSVGEGWMQMQIALSCFVTDGEDLTHVTEALRIESSGALSLQLASVRLVSGTASPDCG